MKEILLKDRINTIQIRLIDKVDASLALQTSELINELWEQNQKMLQQADLLFPGFRDYWYGFLDDEEVKKERAAKYQLLKD